MEETLNKLITSNFKFDELYQFHFFSDLAINPVYTIAKAMFEHPLIVVLLISLKIWVVIYMQKVTIHK